MMVNPAKTRRNSNSGRFVGQLQLQLHKIPTAARKYTNSTTSDSVPAQQSSSANSTSLLSTHVLSDDPIKNIILTDVNASAGRPPTKLSLQPDGVLQSSTNGVITTLGDHVSTVAGASATASEAAVISNTTISRGEKDKRVLRSKGGSSRATSSLARFFPDFEDIVFGETKEPDIINLDSIIYITEKKVKVQDTPQQKPQSPTSLRPPTSPVSPTSLVDRSTDAAPGSREPAAEVWPKVDFSTILEQAHLLNQDPLPDTYFLSTHKRGERKEKQLRNIEKEHALHEKSDLERLLNELKGPDWLKTMGVSGITETEKKKFEPHRDLYLYRVRALLDKFTAWKEQERDLKLKRDEALAAKEEVEAAEEDDNEESVADEEYSFSEVADASARQLQIEAHSANRPKIKLKLRLSKPVLLEPEPPKPFISFFSKPYLRAAALGNHRRGRSTTAFGLPLPEVAERMFTLPNDFTTEEALMTNARKRRRLKRESNVGEAG